MFDVGFPELVLVAIVGLLVIGPERLPEALRTLGLWLGRMRRSFMAVKSEIEKEIGMDEVRRQLHNEAIMDEMKRIENEVRSTADDVRSSAADVRHTLNDASSGAEPTAALTEPGTSTADEAASAGAPEQAAEEAAPATREGGKVPERPPGDPQPPADTEGPARANNG